MPVRGSSDTERILQVVFVVIFGIMLAMPQPKVYSLIDKAIYDYAMLADGARILVGASGGKDSTLLLEYFSNRMRRKSGTFSVTALHVQTDFAPPLGSEILDLLRSWNIPVDILNVNTLERVKPGRKMNCYWCSMQRRRELLGYAIENGYDAIALGHHLDDVLETLLMNMLYKGKLETMPPVFQYREYPMKIIRPLVYVEERKISSYSERSGWKSAVCTCNYQNNSGRKEARRRLEALTDGDGALKKRLLLSLKHIEPEYLP